MCVYMYVVPTYFVIPSFGRLRQENHEFKVSLNCVAKLHVQRKRGRDRDSQARGGSVVGPVQQISKVS